MQNITIAHQQPIAQAHDDDHLVDLFLRRKRSENTRRAYAAAIEQFRAFVGGENFGRVTLQHLLDYQEHLAAQNYGQSTQRLKIAVVRSLLTFAQKIGYIHVNVGAAVEAPSPKNTLAERILTEEQVLAMISATKRKRDRVLLRVLYASAGRVSEVAGLTWRDVQPNGDAGQVTLYGKGGKTRAVLLSKKTWAELCALRAGLNDPVFVSQRGGALEQSAIWRIVKSAGERVGIEGVSPHWLRHSHASHALERGASVALVRDTLGHADASITSRYLHAKPGDSSALHLVV